jgi:hypothetical protein
VVIMANVQNEINLGRVDLLQPEKEKLKSIWSYKLSPMLSSAGGYVKAHPWMSAGLGTAGAANIGGLFDNDKIGGQLVGGLGGYAVGRYLLPQLLGTVSPQAKVLATLGGGALGSLFDKLRQNKEDQYNAQMQQGGYY